MSHTVLLIDDEPNVLDGLTRVLRKEPYNILTANSAEEAAGLLKDNSVDLIVSDEDMPGMSGTEFLGKVAQQCPDTVCLVLTGHPTLSAARHQRREGLSVLHEAVQRDRRRSYHPGRGTIAMLKKAGDDMFVALASRLAAIVILGAASLSGLSQTETERADRSTAGNRRTIRVLPHAPARNGPEVASRPIAAIRSSQSD